MVDLNKPERTRLTVKATPVKEVPEGKKIARRPEYDEVFKKVMESPEKIFKIEVDGRTVKTMYAPFASRVKRYNRQSDRKFNAQLKVRSKEIYIVKLDKTN